MRELANVKLHLACQNHSGSHLHKLKLYRRYNNNPKTNQSLIYKTMVVSICVINNQLRK